MAAEAAYRADHIADVEETIDRHQPAQFIFQTKVTETLGVRPYHVKEAVACRDDRIGGVVQSEVAGKEMVQNRLLVYFEGIRRPCRCLGQLVRREGGAY
jgi:hypothetical protein